MLKITRPITCPKCEKDMGNYSLDTAKERVVFRCKCGCVQNVSFNEYKQLLRNKYQIK